jgi:hypothetical protein
VAFAVVAVEVSAVVVEEGSAAVEGAVVGAGRTSN